MHNEFTLVVRTKKVNDTFCPGRLSIHTGIFDSESKDTEPEGIVMRSLIGRVE